MTDMQAASSIPRHGLSKSRLTAWEQCDRRLWLSVHRPDQATRDEGAELRFAAGHEVGAIACQLLPDGVMIEADPDLRAALATTRRLLEAPADYPLFEATLEHDGVLVRIDVLEPEPAGGWRLAEVKSSTSAKPYHYPDLATQVWVARQAGLAVSSAAIRHVDNQFVLRTPGDYAGLLKDKDCLADIETVIDARGAVVEEARRTLAGDEPRTPTGDHCHAPFSCEFSAYCRQEAPDPPAWPVTVLPNGGGRRWLDLGVEDLLAVPGDELTSEVQRRVHAATLSGQGFHDAVQARAMMAQWAWPRVWLDFETIAFAVPRWIGTRPYQQIPFQFSAHIEQADGVIEHHGFLSLDGADPRRSCAEALLAALPATGAVIAYNAPFERARIRELAAAFADLADPLSGLADRVVDLLPVARACWYHRDQRGSWSIKSVLPTIAPELDYAELEVKDGGQAQIAWLEVTAGCAPERREQLALAMHRYCERDTWAMVVVARRLAEDPPPA